MTIKTLGKVISVSLLFDQYYHINDKLSLSDLCSRGNKMRSAVLIDNSFVKITFIRLSDLCSKENKIYQENKESS